MDLRTKLEILRVGRLQLNAVGRMPWEQFVQALASGGGGDASGAEGVVYDFYCQQDLVTCEHGSGEMRSDVLPEAARAELVHAVRASPMRDLSGSLGPWMSSKLYVGPADTLAPCHWDALDNIYLQIGGSKSFLLFSPDTPALRPFPADHPYDSRSQVDLERPEQGCDPALFAAGGLAELRCGDALYIPSQWFHHVQATGLSPSISLNFWYNPYLELAAKVFPWPARPHIHANVARACETIAAAHLESPADTAAFFADVAAGLDAAQPMASDRRRPADRCDRGANGEEAGAPPAVGATAGAGAGATADAGGEGGGVLRGERDDDGELRGMRNYLIRALVAAYGQVGAARFCQTFLPPERWGQLRPCL